MTTGRASTVIVPALLVGAFVGRAPLMDNRLAVPRSTCGQQLSEPSVIVALPGHPFSVVPTSDGCRLFVSVSSPDPRSNGVAILRRSDRGFDVERVYTVASVEGRPAQRPGPSGMVLTHDGRLLIASNDREVIFFDVGQLIAGDPDAVAGRMSDGASAGSIYVNVTRDDHLLFVSDEHAQTITVIDLENARRHKFDPSAVVGRIPAGVASIALTFSPDERWLYTTSEVAPQSWGWPIACPPDRADRDRFKNPEVPEGVLMVIDVRRARTDPAGSVVAKVPAGCSAVRLAVTPDGRSVWVSARRSDSVVGFETSKLFREPQHARIGLVGVGTAPVGITALPDGRHIVVANSNRIATNPNLPQTLSVIDRQGVKPVVVGTIAAGAFPREFSQSADRRTLYLGNFLSDTLQVMDLTRLSALLQRQ